MQHTRSLRSWIGGAVLAVAASASAQDPEVASRSQVSTTDGLDAQKGGDVGAEKMFDQGKTYIKKMQEAVRKIEKKAEEAKRQKDLIKLNCLNEKLSQANNQAQDAERALSALGDAIVRNDTGERKHEFSRIRILHQKVLVLAAEAETCAGEDSGYVGPAQIDVEVDPSVPQGDPTDPGLPTPTFVAPPPGVEEAVSDSPSSNP